MATEDGITLNDTQEKMVDISEGNPGALSILVQLYPYTEMIDYLHEQAPELAEALGLRLLEAFAALAG